MSILEQEILNEDQKDCLQELMNISYGSATAAIADIISKFAKLSIPKITTLDKNGFKNYISKKIENFDKFYLVNQIVDGKLSGENLFLIDETSLYNLSIEFGLDESEIEEIDLKDIVLEITNIISSTTSSKLAELIETDILFSPPSVRKVSSVDNINDHYETNYEHVIIISTLIEFEEQNISSELVMMLKNDSFIFLQKALDTILENY